MIEVDDFESKFREVYSYHNVSCGEKCCKHCRYWKNKISDTEISQIADLFSERLRKRLKNGEASVCKAASRMLADAVERDDAFMVTDHDGHCTLFKMSILRAIKNIFHKQGGQA